MLASVPVSRIRARRGFAVVIVLAAFVLVALCSYLFIERHQAPAVDSAAELARKNARAQSFVQTQIDTALAAYQKDVGHYPVTAEGLWALVEAPPRTDNWHGPYLASLPADPWNHIYQYAYPGTHNSQKYDAWSIGADGVNSTSDDIKNW